MEPAYPARPRAPSVSLIVLNWNGKQHLDDSLGSLVRLDYPRDRLQLILCDNGSTDGSAEFVRGRFPEVEVVQLDRNLGFATGNNRAVAQASGEWVGFLNNDMRVDPTWLKDMLAPLTEQPSLACIASRIMSWDGRRIDFVGGGVNFHGVGFHFDSGKRSSLHDGGRRLLFACGGAMLVRRQIFLELDGFDDQFFAFYEDVDLGWRLNLLGHDVWYNPDATAYHRGHSTADKVASAKMRLLYERNGLFTMFKCLDEENLRLALPASLLLLNERSLRMGEVDVRPFMFEAPDRPPPLPAGRLHAWDPGQKVSLGVIARARRVWREQGLWAVVRRSLRIAGRLASATVRRVQRRLVPHGTLLPDVAVANYVAMGEFTNHLDSLLTRRNWLQERRRRSDSELIPLFHFALTPAYSDPHYVQLFEDLCRTLGIQERFAAGQD